jgi:hypothetical protein
MKRSFILSIIGLLSVLPVIAADVTNSTENLVFGKMWMEGGCRANLVQRLHIEVTNRGKKNYNAYWGAFEPQEDGYYDSGRLVNYVGVVPYIKAGQTEEVTMELLFLQAGHYSVNVWTNMGDTELFTYPVDIAEYQAPRIKGELHLDMLEKTDEGNILYGNFAHFRITGTATITNEDENTVIGWEGLETDGANDIQCVIKPWFGNNNWYKPWNYDLGHEIKPGETITKDFIYEFTAVPEKDKEYSIQIEVAGNTVTRIPFKVKQSTNTYWTADGQVKPLPIGPNQVLKVPSEALAVDLCGQYEMNTVFTMDISLANPNCLYYLGFLDNVPQGMSLATNVIRDYEAKTLFIDADYDYYCPMPFKAKTAIFKYIPGVKGKRPYFPIMNSIVSGALVLPFDPDYAELTAMNGSSEYDGYSWPDILPLRFVRDDKTVLFFKNIEGQQLKAYEPYLMYFKPSPISFFAEDIIIPTTRPAVAEGKDFVFVGHTTAVTPSEHVFQWDMENHNGFNRCKTDERVRPFNALMYLKEGSKDMVLDKLMIDREKEATGIIHVDNVNAIVPKSAEVYSLSGQRVGTAEMKADGMSINNLKPGLYIIGGKKVVVK